MDYSSLSIRHLGSIYEGLLEYKLKFAEENLVVESKKGKEIYRKAKKGEPPKVYKDDIYLVTDKGERKATGSYYTPDYIVKYIVENTIGPIVDERIEKAKREGKDVVEELLSIKILDPAMGSGHFLVEATNFLSNRIIEYMQDSGEYEEIPELNEMKRRVVERCIYGVDLNPLAVELAKVSLWLDTVSKNKALSFLDHHLQCGNSLIGAFFNDISAALPKAGKKKSKRKKKHTPSEAQATIFSTAFNALARQMIRRRMEIERLPSDTVDDIKKKEELLAEAEQLRQRFKEVLDIYTSQYFGNEVPTVEFNNLIISINADDSTWKEFKEREWFKKAMQISSEKRFFNWEIRFPEIFFDEYGSVKDNPGFDAVIGNPPYVRQELIVKDKSYLEEIYEVYLGRADIYEYFIERGLNLIKNHGLLSFITSKKFMNVSYGEPLRKLIVKETKICEIVDFGDLPVFGNEVIAYPCIIILKKPLDTNENEFLYTKIKSLDFDSLKSVIDGKGIKILQKGLGVGKEWVFHGKEVLDLQRKIERISKPLIDISGEPLVGIKTGLNDVFVTDNNGVKNITKGSKKEMMLFKKFIFGKSIKRYDISPSEKYLLFPYERGDDEILRVVDLDEYPNIKNYLESFKSEVISRAIIKEKAPKGEMKWYELQQINKNISFEKPKIIYPDISDTSNFALDTSGSLIDMTAFIIESGDPYILSLLNSKLLTWLLGLHCVRARGDYLRFKTQYVSRLPIRCVNFTTPEDERTKLVSELKGLYAELNFPEILSKVESYLPKDTEGNFITEKEKSDVVHDFLAFLAEQMIKMKKQEHKLQGALDLFKYLSPDEDVNAFSSLFKEEIKYARPLNKEILERNHDITSLRLKKEGEEWVLEAELKLRDEEDNFVKEGNRIKYEWAEIYAFDMDDNKAGFYRAVFDNLKGFNNARIPGGKTKSVKNKLFRANIPVFEERKSSNIKPYLELEEELKLLEDKIQKTDDLIDQIVYRLYGLTDDEIKIVENAVREI
ncbi:Eco57I restriction-modification methylase domain-containing protein [Candidatus Pyrohabitans sp.]